MAQGPGFNRYFSSLLDGVRGLDAVGRISYQFPMQNSLASGRLAEADAQMLQATTRLADVERTIRSSIVQASSALRTALLRLEQTRESVAAFEDALRGEQDKLALGIGSIVNLLTIEDRLTSASDREVAAWRSYAQALVEFRFATGTLVAPRDQLPAPDLATFTTLPGAPIGGRR
jgi:outer membrane protein